MNAEITVDSTMELDLPGCCRPMAEFSPIPMAALEGSSLIIRYMNHAFCLLLGKTRAELIGSTFSCAVPAADVALIKWVYKTGHAQFHAGEDSSSISFDWSYTLWPIYATDARRVGVMIQVTGAAPFHQQATAINQALIISSVRQHELTDEAEALNDQLRWANEDLKQFAFAASHDLQEPLRMITSYSQLLLKGYRGQLDDEAAVCVDFITKGTKQMRNLLANLLSYTEVGTERQEADEHIDLNTILDRVQQNLKLAIEESEAVVTSADLPAVRGHDARFMQLFQNLIGNGIKYRGKEPPRIHVSAEQRAGEWRFAVADNGMGIEPEYFQMVFGVFKRLHGNAISGTGIGLAICQRVVERYGGRIWIESQVGHGTTFYFTLPRIGGNQ